MGSGNREVGRRITRESGSREVGTASGPGTKDDSHAKWEQGAGKKDYTGTGNRELGRMITWESGSREVRRRITWEVGTGKWE